MGRYTTRFVGNGANGVGATYTAAAGGGNSDYSVAANGQALLRSDYPALAAYYSGQTVLDTLNDINIVSSGFSNGSGFLWTPTGNRTSNYGGGQVSAKFSGFHLYLQPVARSNTTGTVTGSKIWYTQDSGVSWKLTDFLGNFASGGLITTQSAVYICHESGMHRTTDGLNYTYVYNKTPVFGVTEQSGTVIFTTGDSTYNLTSTGDFVNITGVSAGAFTPYPVVNYSGVLYAFAAGSTGVRFSTNTGQTWSSPTSGRSMASGGLHATVVNNYLLVFGYGTGVPIYEYSTNPTGTTNTWTSINRNTRNDTASSVVYCTSVEYDSGTNNLLLGWQHYLNGSGASEIFGYIATGITGTPIPCTGTTTTCVFTGYLAASSGYSYPFFLASGSKKTLYNDWLFKVELVSGTWDSTVTNVALNSFPVPSGYGMTPFIPAANFAPSGYAALGTTNSGSRYIVKLNAAAASTGFVGICSAYVEVSGFFKQLTSVSGSTEYLRANYGISSTSLFSSNDSNYSNITLAEASGNYILAWTATGTPNGIYYNRYNQATLKSNTDFTRHSGLSNSVNFSACSTKDDGIYFLVNSAIAALMSGALVPASGTPALFDATPRNIVGNVSGFPMIYYSNVDNEVLISCYTSTGTITGATVSINQGIVSVSTFSLIDTSGNTVSIPSGTAVVKSQGNYYAITPSGVIYQGATRFVFSRYGAGVGFPSPGNGPNTVTFRGISNTKILGPIVINNKYGSVTTSLLKNVNFANDVSNRHPEVFQYTASSYLVVAGGGYNTVETPFPGTGSFVVPNITTASSGEAKYIIAR
jgi:hypothetical protein